jgi:DnaK suppressor protein
MRAQDRAGLERVLKLTETRLSTILARREGIDIQNCPDSTEAAQYRLDRELAARSLHQGSGTLAAVRLAMNRIAGKNYGTCERCDSPIGPKRLMAIPWARYCIACQEALDEENGANQTTAYLD